MDLRSISELFTNGMMTMNLTDLCFHLRNRRRMYLPDDRFSTAVAFVEGYNTALDGIPLSGFQGYVAMRVLNRESSLHWSCLIASTKVPEMLDGNGYWTDCR